MANIHSANHIQDPTGTLGTGGGGSGNATVELSSMWKREMSIYPIVDAVNGPLTADSLITSGDVSSTTGLRFIPWTATDQVTGQPLFNYQGMVPSTAPSNIQTAAGRAALLNAFTPRWFNGSTGQYYNGNQDIRVGIASQRVIPVWYVSQGQINGTNIDMQVMVQHGSENKHLSSANNVADGMPTVGGSSAGTYRRELTYIDSRYREHRFLLSPNSYFLGVWIDTLSAIQRPKNKPQLFVHGVDSWQDPQTVIGNGTGYTGRDYQCLPQCVVASFRTGMCHGVDGQGGTGEFNANGTSGGDAENYNGNRSSAAWSDSRVNWRVNWWGSQYPIFTDIGGWNDGNACPAPYQSSYATRVAARIQKHISAAQAVGLDARFLNVGIQPADIPNTSYLKYLMELGQAEIPGMFPGVVIGHVPLMQMWWYDTTTTGPRSIYCNNSDHIHLLAIGDDSVCGWIWDEAGAFPIDTAYLAKTAAAEVPIVSVPTS